MLDYAALVAILRIFGNQSLAKLNAFDLVVTVALGSTLATVLLSDRVALAEGVMAMVLLILLQFVITRLSVRSPVFRALVTNEPTLLLREGCFLDKAMMMQRIARDEVMAAPRASGVADAAQAAAVILETDGSLAAIRTDQARPGKGHARVAARRLIEIEQAAQP